MAAAQVSGVQTLNIRSQGAVGNNTGGNGVANFDVSGWTGLTAVNVTQSTGADYLKVGANTAVTVSDTAGKVTLVGGTTQTVNTAGGFALSGATGNVTVVDTAQAGVVSSVDGGANVSVAVTATNPGAGTGAITIGGTVKPTGTVGVTQNLTNVAGVSGGAADTTGGLVTVNGGTVVTVTKTAAQAVQTTATSNATIVEGGITVNGGAATTSVTANQAATVAAANTVLAATETASVAALGANLVAGQSLTIGGLTFTAGHSVAVTPAMVAAAFANLANGATTGAGSTYGTYSGALTGWSSASPNGSNAVLFTSSTAASNVTNLTATATGGATAPTVTTTAGAAASGTGGVTAGDVIVLDANYASAAGTSAGTITNVTANNYGTLTISDNNVTSVTAVGGGNITINNASARVTPTTTLALNLAGVSGAFQDANVITTLNITTSGTASTLSALTDTALTALTVAGTAGLTATTAGATGLKTVTVSGSAGLTASDLTQASLTDVNASATSGNNTVTITAATASYEGGTGNDVVTLNSSTVSKTVTLGTGNDKVVLASGTTTLGANGYLIGGLGTDTLQMLAADAATASGNAAFVTHISGFENLAISTLAGSAVSVDVGLLGTASSLTINAGSGTGTAANNTFANFASGGTVTVNATQAGGITLSNVDWTTSGHTTDSASIVLGAATAIGGGVGFTVASAGLDSLTITSNGVDTSGVAVAQQLTLADTSTTSLTINGGSALTLHAVGDTALTTINAASATAGLTVAAGDTAATVTSITGSATAANSLAATSAAATAVTLTGGSGNDTFTANGGLGVINVGTGFDTVNALTASGSSNIYTTINGMGVGDTLNVKVSGTSVFTATAISLAPTATFQNYLDAAAAGNGSVNGIVKWFQFGGNTYVVDDVTAAGTYAATDVVVALTGLVDLSHATIIGTNSLLIG